MKTDKPWQEPVTEDVVRNRQLQSRQNQQLEMFNVSGTDTTQTSTPAVINKPHADSVVEFVVVRIGKRKFKVPAFLVTE